MYTKKLKSKATSQSSFGTSAGNDDSSTLTYRKLKSLPCNLRKKEIREARNRNETIPGAPKPKIRKRHEDPALEKVRMEHEALVKATENELKKILAECDLLSDIPYDCTPQELLGEIAIAKGHATTIYVEREGLSTLTVVLHQEKPTIANLKHAISHLSRIDNKRRQRERHEERFRRRRNAKAANTISTTSYSSEEEAEQRQVNMPARSTGELVCSATYHGHQHRANVSWKFLWRAYTLFNVSTNQPIDDENGRALLTDLGIENAATLKFTHRVKYFGRNRQ